MSPITYIYTPPPPRLSAARLQHQRTKSCNNTSQKRRTAHESRVRGAGENRGGRRFRGRDGDVARGLCGQDNTDAGSGGGANGDVDGRDASGGRGRRGCCRGCGRCRGKGGGWGRGRAGSGRCAGKVEGNADAGAELNGEGFGFLEISWGASSFDGRAEGSDERRGRADALDVSLLAASGTKRSDGWAQSTGGNLGEVYSTDERGGESQKSDFERNHFD